MLDGLGPVRRSGGPTSDHLAIVGTHELDDECAHLGMLGPGRVRDVGRPDGRLTGRDPCPVLADADPAAPLTTMNQVEFGLVCGSMRAPRAKASSVMVPRPSDAMTCPVSPTDPIGPSGRR